MQEIEELMQRVEKNLNSLSNSLSQIENKIDGQNYNPANFEIPADENFSDLTNLKSALDKMQSARREFFQYTLAQNQDLKFAGVNELQRLSKVLTALTQETKNFSSQCEYLEQTRRNLESTDELKKLVSTLKNFESSLSELGTYNEKINDATSTAQKNIENMQEILDDKISTAANLEKELLITSHELRQTAKNFSAPVQTFDNEKFSEIQKSIDALYQKLNDNDSKPALFQNICQEIARIIYSKDNVDAFNKMKDIRLSEFEVRNLNSFTRGKVESLAQGFNHFFKVYSEIKTVLEKNR